MTGTPRIMAHLVAWYPDGPTSLDVARGLADGGCAYLEVQFPFSDPTADGPDIQRACGAALEAGFTMDKGFGLLTEIARGTGVPVFVMSYANLVFTRGTERFLKECRGCGVKGVIVPDLPPGYDEGLYDKARDLGLEAVPVLSPSIQDERLARVASLAPAYVYATLRAGTTGTFTTIDAESIAFLERVAAAPAGPAPKILGGFGVSTREQVAALQPHVHAVVVGSALVREVAGAANAYEAVRAKLLWLAGN